MAEPLRSRNPLLTYLAEARHFTYPMTSMSAPVQLINVAPLARLDPAWDHARELLRDGRRTAEEFAEEIERLRERYLHEGHGGDHGTNQHAKWQVSQGVKLASGAGFVAQLEVQLGLHPEQAKRILDRVRYTRMLRAAADGQAVKYLTGTGKGKHEETFLPDDEAQARAQRLLDEVVAGDVKPSAAWAGVCGEARRVAASGKKERAAINHEENIARGLKKLATSLEHWAELTPAGRARLESLWNQLRKAGVIPTTWQ